MKRPIRCRIATALLALAAAPVAAVQVCELNGQGVNPANGNTTAGKTGLMRCRDGEGGPVVREEELRNGRFIGIVRHFRNGVLQSELSVNEQGNRDGVVREFAAAESGENRLVREETMKNGTTVGIARAWHANGKLRRVAFHADNGREEAVAEFDAEGRLSELRCAPRAVLAPAADDAAWCGHAGERLPVTLYGAGGRVAGKVIYERGELRERETLWPNGRPREQATFTATGGRATTYYEEGAKRQELEWIQTAGERARRTTVAEREFHASGTLVRERRWTPTASGADLSFEQHWYLNGQPREKAERIVEDGRPVLRATRFHDNGRPAFEGVWSLGARGSRQATGVHKVYDDAGRLRRESFHDARGRVSRERELDATGAVVRDDELFEDGSRKAFSR